MTKATIPISQIEGIELHDGDSIHGAVSNGQVTITVLTGNTRKNSNQSLSELVKSSRQGLRLGRKASESLRDVIHEGHRCLGA